MAAVFGLVYVVVNTGPLPAWAATPLRALGALAFVAVVAGAYRAARTYPVATAGRGRGFGTAYWLVVAAEAVALPAGVRVLSGPLDTPHAGVAWVSFVVGVHFFAIAVVASVVPGMLLLASGWWGTRRTLRPRPRAARGLAKVMGFRVDRTGADYRAVGRRAPMVRLDPVPA
ncbi:MAG TPA: hypothetical protein VHG70_10245 [Nocardioidaceae bacterium]|nr:hypothetical protein [Nocardioidaceae bacterium]